MNPTPDSLQATMAMLSVSLAPSPATHRPSLPVTPGRIFSVTSWKTREGKGS
ncbi:hypothetical protein YC2023_077087 [Brassica napus]